MNPGQALTIVPRQDSSRHASSEVYVKFLPDSQMVAVSGRVWDLTPRMRGEVKGTVFSPDGTLVGASSAQGEPQVFDRNGKLLATLRGHAEGAFVQAIDSSQLILTEGGDSTIRLWDISPHFTAEFTSWRTTFSMAMSDDATVAATQDTSYEATSAGAMPNIGRDNAVALWDARGNLLGEFPRAPGNRSSRIFLGPDAAHLAIVEHGGDANLWDTQRRTKRSIHAQGADVIAVTFTAPEPQLITKQDSSIHLRDWAGNERTFALENAPVSIVLDPEGTHLVAASLKGVSVWDLHGKHLTSFDRPLAQDAVVLPGSGLEQVALRSDGRTIVLDMQGKVIADFGQAAAQALSPDGRLLATSGGYYAVATIWDVASLQPVARLEGNGDFEMRFSRDGKFVSVVGNDGPARLWRIDSPEELVAKACQQIAGYLQNSSNSSDEDRSLCRSPGVATAAPE
jgi:WD40 repeat protein